MHRRSSTSLYTKGVWVCMALTLAIQLTHCTPTQRSRPLLYHHLTKRAFADQQCKGVYDKGIYARLDRICEDCYNLFREPELHSLCKTNCFKSPYFQACIEAFHFGNEAENDIYDLVKRMNKRRL